MDCRVELRFAPLPLIGALAVHYWFVVLDEGGCHRWEVWQTKNAGGDRCIGHVHRDLKAPEEGVGGGASRVEKQWVGEEARRIIRILDCVETYPWCQRYRYWPGPNSNTFAAWVLRRAGINFRFGRKAIGAGYLAAKQ